ncbi:hypothetical protein ACN077_24965 [Clostridium chromiireducens]|uniref:hypothetical protein n=1 Tax=Clostridium chromiireducens TaxID=225345 RepID=UPI003AF90CCA
MIEKILNVAITKCYGNADENSTRGKFNIPKKIILEQLSISEDYNENIKKNDCIDYYLTNNFNFNKYN